MKFVGLSRLIDMIHFRSQQQSAWWPWHLTFRPWNWCSLLFLATHLSILLCLRLFVLDIWANTCQANHATLSPWPWTLEVMMLPVMRLFMLKQCIKCEVRSLPIRHYDALPFQQLSAWWPWSSDFETSALYCPWQASYQFQCFWVFFLDWPRDLATLTFDLGWHGVCRWYGSSYSICVQSFKFVCLSVRKTWRTSGLSISRPGDLDLWPWNRYSVAWTIFLPI